VTDPQNALKLIYRANIFVVNRTHPALQMGRGDSNDIVIVSLFASRVHARVEARDGQFVLVDLSSNGTFVLLDDPSRAESDTQSTEESDAQLPEIRLREEELVLTGRGWLGMGRSAGKHGDHSVRFSVETEAG
jgi:hypothetical protein